VDDAYKVFFTDHRVEANKKAAAFNIISEEQTSSNGDPEIAAFHLQGRTQNKSGQQNYNQQNSNNRN
jgi:hypothetical protein